MTTVGMNYEIIEGKEVAFEKKFAMVMDVMQGVPGHVRTNLYKDAFTERSYLVVSEWSTREHFDGFIASEAFRATTAWGEANILASRPSHVVYGADAIDVAGEQCPSQAERPA